MTYDAQPTGTTSEIRAKFEGLWASYTGPKPTTVASSIFTRAIVSRLKLIYELWGEQLVDTRSDSDQVHRAIALYDNHLDINPSCMVDIDTSTHSAGCTATSVAENEGDLVRCQRLVGPHASEAIASVALNGCEQVLSSYLDLAATATQDTSCKGALLRQVAAKATFQLTDKQLGMVARAPTTLGALPRQLWLLDRWYSVAKRADELGVFPTADLQQRDTSYLLGRFWDRVHQRSNIDGALRALSDASSNEDAELALNVTAVNGRQGEQQVVTAMFSNGGVIQPENVTLTGPPLHGPPLLALLGDALKPFIDDLDGLAVYHDIACQFTDCRSPTTLTPSRNAWNILANLEASPGLQTAVNSNTHLLAGWKAVFNSIASNQSTLAQAVSQVVSGPNGLAGTATAADVAPLARPLWVLYQHARALHDHYEATGLFESTAQNRIHGSLLQNDQIANVNTLRGRVNRLGGDVASYQNSLLEVVRAQVAVLDAGATIQTLTDHRIRKAQEMAQKSANLEGLRDSGAAEADAFGSMTKSFADIQAALHTGALVTIGSAATFSLSGRDAKFVTSHSLANLTTHTVPGLTAGQMLLVQTSGKWSPTCALRDVGFFKPDGLSSDKADLSNADIGPEGYTLTWTGTSYAARSSAGSTELSRTLGESVRFCQDSGVLGTVAGLNPEACVYADNRITFANSTSSSAGSDHRSSASFATGLRLDDTPFSEAPVGSLLVVLADPSSGAIREVRVVREGGSSIIVEQPSTAYFVVNDRECAAANTSSVLTVEVRTMASEAAVAEASLGAMVDVLADMRTQQDGWVNQGTLLPSQASLLRQRAFQKLQARLGATPVSSLPAPLASLFESFVTHEIVSTERRIEMRAIERSLDLDLIDLRTVDDELNAGATHARLQSLVPRWIVRNLDHDTLRHRLTDVLEVARDNLKPVLELWYPHALENVTLGPELNQLLNADVDTSLVTLADKGQRFVNALLDAYDDGTFGSKPQGTQLPFVVVSFPRPGADVSDSPWRKVDTSRAKRVWDAIASHGKARFEVSPNDFYTVNGGDAVLSCHEVVPVIKTMGFFATRPGDDADNEIINNSGRTIFGAASDTQTFITPAGPRIYQFADAAWQDFVMPVRYGESPAAFSVFVGAQRQTRPVGLSPDGTFEIDFSVLDTQTNTGFEPKAPLPVTEVALVLEIDSRASDQAPTWVKRCQ